MSVVVFLATAVLCVSGRCYPALLGRDTPIGHFPLVRRFVQAKGYGGDVLQFADTDTAVLAIHRVWLGRPAEHRAERLAGADPAKRRFVTNGCINVSPEVYALLSGAETVDIEP